MKRLLAVLFAVAVALPVAADTQVVCSISAQAETACSAITVSQAGQFDQCRCNQNAPAPAGPFGGHATLADGLVSYWPLDEESGVRADLVGSNDLTDNNTVGFANMGPSGVVADFVNANSESLTKTGATGIDWTQNFTVSFWINHTPNANYNGLFAGGTDKTRAYFNPSTEQLVAEIFGTFLNQPVNNITVSLGWHHVVIVFDQSDSNKGYLYVDGVTEGPETITPGVTSNNITFGATSGPSNFFSGKEGRAGVWQRAFSSGDVAGLFNNGKGKLYSELTTAEKVGLVSYWNLDEASGNRSDSHGTNHLTDNNTVTSADNTHPGFGKAASFVAANSEYLSLASQSVITSGQARTVAFWLNRTATAGANDTHFLIGNSVGDGSRLIDIVGQGSDPNAQLTLFVNGTSTPSAGFYSAGQWMLVVYTYDGATTHKIYVDTTERVSYTGGDSGNSGAMFVGNGPASPADMLMGALGVWSRVLTAQERTDLYAAGAGLFYED